LRERILRKTHSVLEPHGLFLVYQFSTRVLQDLRRIFGSVRHQFEPLNVLPAHLFFCRPDAVSAASASNGYGACRDYAAESNGQTSRPTAPIPPPIRSGSERGSR